MKEVFICLFMFSSLLGRAQTYFPPTDGSEEWETLNPESLNWCQEKIDSLYSFLEERNTKAFMILKDGKIVLENYFNGFEPDDLWYWASAGKTLTATLVGKALEDGFLDLEDPVSSYLGVGWTACDSIEEAERTVLHQLTMTSSFDNSTDLWNCTQPECFLCTDSEPGTEWHYHNGVYRLLIAVVEEATGVLRNPYTDQTIEEITGMSGFWVDNLYYSKHRDMGRFGLLALNDFVWDGQPILNDSDFIEALTSPSQSLNPSYGYLWWINGQDSHMFPLNPISYQGSLIPTGPDDMFMALGANDQKIYVIPSENLVVTRQGDDASDGSPAASAFDIDLWAVLSDLECSSLNVEVLNEEKSLEFHPNPSSGDLRIPEISGLDFVAIHSIDGTLVVNAYPGELIAMERGIYIAVGFYQSGYKTTSKLMVK